MTTPTPTEAREALAEFMAMRCLPFAIPLSPEVCDRIEAILREAAERGERERVDEPSGNPFERRQ